MRFSSMESEHGWSKERGCGSACVHMSTWVVQGQVYSWSRENYAQLVKRNLWEVGQGKMNVVGKGEVIIVGQGKGSWLVKKRACFVKGK